MQHKRCAYGLCIVMGMLMVNLHVQAQTGKPFSRHADSLQASLKSKAAGEEKKFLSAVKTPADSLSLKNAGLQGKEQLDALLGQGKSAYQPLVARLKIFDKGGFLVNNKVTTEADYTYIYDTSASLSGFPETRQNIFGYSLSYTTSVMNLPFSMALKGNNGVYSINRSSPDNFYKMNFDHDKYMESLRTAISSKLSPDQVMSSAMGRINSIRGNYEKMLTNEIQELRNDYSKEYASGLAVPDGITNLSVTDLSSLHNKVMGEADAGKYQQDMARMQEMLKSGDMASLKNDPEYIKLSGSVKKYETLEKMYAKVIAWKQRFEDNKAVKELNSNLPFTKQNYQSFLRNPANLEKVIDDHVSLTGIQRLFVNITHLDIGQNAVQSGEFNLENIVNSGINTEYKSRKATVGFIYGKNDNTNQWLQSGLTGAVTNEYSSLAGFTFGSGTGSAIERSLSINFFDFKNQPGGMDPAVANYLPMGKHRDGTISFHTAFPIADKHKITVDVSKSFGSYTNTLTADSLPNKANTMSGLLGDGGKANYAASIDYEGEVLKSDVHVALKKVGLGYSNPGNAYLRRGETQVSAGVARKFIGEKLSVRYGVDFRQQDFDPSGNYRYHSLGNKLQLGWRINRNNRIGILYAQTSNKTRFYGQAASYGGNSRLQMDGTYRLAIGHKKITNNISLGSQRMDIPMLTGGVYKSHSLLFTSTSSMALNKNVLSLTLAGNKSNNKDYYFNTSMFTTEANYSYVLKDNIRLGSSLGYYDNAGWNRQVGIRQQANAVLSGRVNIDLELSYRKAVQVIRPELANQVFIMSVIHYNL